MTIKDDGGPAFPVAGLARVDDQLWSGHGLSKRDYFAAHIVSGFLANQLQDYAPLGRDKIPMLAREAYTLADAMLAARKADYE